MLLHPKNNRQRTAGRAQRKRSQSQHSPTAFRAPTALKQQLAARAVAQSWCSLCYLCTTGFVDPSHPLAMLCMHRAPLQHCLATSLCKQRSSQPLQQVGQTPFYHCSHIDFPLRNKSGAIH